MKTDITFKEAAQRYPELMNEVREKLQAGKSKERFRGAHEMRWELHWAQECRAFSLGEVLAGPTSQPSKRPAQLTEAGTRDYLGTSVIWWLVGRIGRWWGQSTSSRLEIPVEIIRIYLHGYIEDNEEQKRYSSLTPDEQQEELDSLLKKLGASPGFVAVRVPLGGRS